MPVFMTFDQGVPIKIWIDSKQVFFIPYNRPLYGLMKSRNFFQRALVVHPRAIMMSSEYLIANPF